VPSASKKVQKRQFPFHFFINRCKFKVLDPNKLPEGAAALGAAAESPERAQRSEDLQRMTRAAGNAQIQWRMGCWSETGM
jgi:hypothetical protein